MNLPLKVALVERKAVLDLELHKKEKNGEVKKLSRKA